MLVLFLIVFYIIWFSGIIFFSISSDIVSCILLGSIYAVTIPVALILVRGSGVLEAVTCILVAIIVILFILQSIVSFTLS